jgi:toxin CcdB
VARFDVYRSRISAGYLLDCQADLLSVLNTRLVVPLLPEGAIPQFDRQLNPVMTVDGERFVMVTQATVAVPVVQLGKLVGSLASEDFTITAALDMLLSGY